MKQLSNLKSVFANVISGTIIVTIGLFLASILSYILQIFLGRFLTVEEFGVFTSLLSVFYIVGFSNSVFLTSLIKLVSDLRVDDGPKLYGLFKRFTTIFLGIGFGLFLLLMLGMGALTSYLKIDVGEAVFAFTVYVALSLVGIVPQAFLQGLQRYKGFSMFLVMGNLLRTLIPLYFAYLGMGVSGVFYGIILSTLLNYAFGFLLLYKNFVVKSEFELSPYVKRVFEFSAPVFFVNASLMLLNNVDVILVKHYFSATDAGIYSGLITIGKVLLFGAGAVGVVMFPQIAALKSQNLEYIARFKQFLYLQLIIVSVGLLIFLSFPKFIVSVMFGSKFLLASSYLPVFSIFVAIYVLINFFTLFFLAIDKTKIYLVMVPFIVMQWILISLYHKDIDQIIHVNILSSALMLSALLLYYKVHARNSNNSSI